MTVMIEMWYLEYNNRFRYTFWKAGNYDRHSMEKSKNI